MTDRALSEAAMRAGLQDISLPAQAAGGMVAELALTVGLAGLAALALGVLLRALSRRKPKPETPRDALSALQNLAEPERRIAILHVLRARAPERYAQLTRDLYRADTSLSLAALEAEVRRLA